MVHVYSDVNWYVKHRYGESLLYCTTLSDLRNHLLRRGDWEIRMCRGSVSVALLTVRWFPLPSHPLFELPTFPRHCWLYSSRFLLYLLSLFLYPWPSELLLLRCLSLVSSLYCLVNISRYLGSESLPILLKIRRERGRERQRRWWSSASIGKRPRPLMGRSRAPPVWGRR